MNWLVKRLVRWRLRRSEDFTQWFLKGGMTIGVMVLMRQLVGQENAAYYLEGCRRLIEACDLDCREEFNAAVEALD